jgi:predicted metal-binding protein
MDADLEKYGRYALENEATQVKQVDLQSVVTAPWVRLKCQFGCPGFDKGYCCPPHTPTPEETRKILDYYNRAILFHIEVPHMLEREKLYRRYFDRLVTLEGNLFKDGYYKAFLFLSGPCRICKTCAKQEGTACNFLYRARPSMEGCGIDVYQTARNNGFFIKTLREKTETQNEYCLMLVD